MNEVISSKCNFSEASYCSPIIELLVIKSCSKWKTFTSNLLATQSQHLNYFLSYVWYC